MPLRSNQLGGALRVPNANSDDTHIILLRDPRRCLCLAGISGLGTSYGICSDNLERIIYSLDMSENASPSVFPSGGAGALKFGCDLGADGVLGFSIPTTLNIADDPGADLARYPQLWKLYSYDLGLGIDLAEYYRRTVPRPALTLIYSGVHVRDRWLAERMRGIWGGHGC